MYRLATLQTSVAETQQALEDMVTELERGVLSDGVLALVRVLPRFSVLR